MTYALYLKNILFLLSAVNFLAACQVEHEKSAPPLLKPSVSHKTTKEMPAVVPPDVKKTWSAVKIAVIDKTRATENIYTVPIGSLYRIPSTNLTITAEAFLPSFVMEGTIKTSSSNELNNPGVKVRIVDNGQSVFNGWLFSRFPTTHAVTHPKFGFTLVGAVRSSK